MGCRDFATHWIHWYPAKMFYRIPREILKSLDRPRGSVILDPFCGSGTVLLEAILLGHEAIGIDVNPIARLISKVKTAPLDSSHVLKHLPDILKRASEPMPAESSPQALRYWFKPSVLQALLRLRESVRKVRHSGCRDFYLATLSSIVRSVSLADPSIAPPVKMTPLRLEKANARYRRDYLRAQGFRACGVLGVFEEAVTRNIGRVRELATVPEKGGATLLPSTAEASATGLPPSSVDMILTSPPYCGAQKYVRSLRLEMLVLGIHPDHIAEADRRTLGTERLSTISGSLRLRTLCPPADDLISAIQMRNPTRALMLAEYVRYLRLFAAECKRILRPSGDAFVTFGTSTIAGCTVDVAALFSMLSIEVGLTHVATLTDRIPSRGLLTRRNSDAPTIDDERVVWLRR